MARIPTREVTPPPTPERQPAGASRFARFGLKSPRSPEEGALRPEGWSGTRLPLSLSPEEGALPRKAGLEPDFRCP